MWAGRSPSHNWCECDTGRQGGNKVGELEKEQRLESGEPLIQPKYPKAQGEPWEHFNQGQT